MSGEREAQSRISILRIVGALLVVLAVLWFALPFWLRWFLAAPGMPEVDLFPRRPPIFEPWPYVGLIIILFGLGFLDLARGRWLPVAIVTLAVSAVVLSLRPFG
jgi:hypothetical protein